MNHANSTLDGVAQRVLTTAIGYADWILGGPAPNTQVNKNRQAQRDAENSNMRRANPVLWTANLDAPCLVYGARIFPFIGALIFVGRDPHATICIDPSFEGWETMSPCHARLMPRNGRWLIRDGYTDDAPSENGIYVNGKRTRVNYLVDHWMIAFGQVEFRFYSSVAIAQQAQDNGLANARACPNCGGVSDAAAKFCQGCGRVLASLKIPVRATV